MGIVKTNYIRHRSQNNYSSQLSSIKYFWPETIGYITKHLQNIVISSLRLDYDIPQVFRE